MAECYVICTRNVSKGKFGNEPGPTRFLVVPEGGSLHPDQAIPRSRWVDRVLAEAKTKEATGPGEHEGDILVFVHGYNNSPEDVLVSHRQLSEDLVEQGFEGALLSFDWPSADSALNYLEDRSDAKATALRLVTDGIRPFSVYQAKNCKLNLHVLAHSTGAYVIREAFDDADDRRSIAAHSWTVSQVALIAADISQGSMSRGNAKSSSLFRHSVRITNYNNPHDSVLKLSNVKRIGVAPRVGRVGLPADAPGNCVNVNCGPYWKTLDEDTATFTGNFSHSWYIGDPVFARDLVLTMRGDIDRREIPTRRSRDGQLVLTT